MASVHVLLVLPVTTVHYELAQASAMGRATATMDSVSVKMALPVSIVPFHRTKVAAVLSIVCAAVLRYAAKCIMRKA